MKACPHCGGTEGFDWLENQVEHKYIGAWGGGLEGVDCTMTAYTRPRTKFARCLDCRKRVLIEAAINDSAPTVRELEREGS